MQILFQTLGVETPPDTASGADNPDLGKQQESGQKDIVFSADLPVEVVVENGALAVRAVHDELPKGDIDGAGWPQRTLAIAAHVPLAASTDVSINGKPTGMEDMGKKVATQPAKIDTAASAPSVEITAIKPPLATPSNPLNVETKEQVFKRNEVVPQNNLVASTAPAQAVVKATPPDMPAPDIAPKERPDVLPRKVVALPTQAAEQAILATSKPKAPVQFTGGRAEPSAAANTDLPKPAIDRLVTKTVSLPLKQPDGKFDSVVPENPLPDQKQKPSQPVVTEPGKPLVATKGGAKSPVADPLTAPKAERTNLETLVRAAPKPIVGESSTVGETSTKIVFHPQSNRRRPDQVAPQSDPPLQDVRPATSDARQSPQAFQPKPNHDAPPAKAVAPTPPVADLPANRKREGRALSTPVAEGNQPTTKVAIPTAPAVVNQGTQIVPAHAALHWRDIDKLSGADGSSGRDLTSALAASDATDGRRVEAASTKSEPMARPVMQQLSQAARTANGGTVEVRLYPEELGRVRLSLSPSETNVTVQIFAERPETLDLIRRNLDIFAQTLRQEGFTELDFSFGDAPGQKENDPSENEDTSVEHTFGPEPTNPTNPAPSTVHPGQLDIRL